MKGGDDCVISALSQSNSPMSMRTLLSNHSDTTLLQRAWDLDQQALSTESVAMRRRLWREALNICRRLLRKYEWRNQLDVLQLLSKIAVMNMHQRKFAIAKRYLDRARRLSKRDPIILYYYGSLYRSMGQSRLALRFYRSAARLGRNAIFTRELQRYQREVRRRRRSENEVLDIRPFAKFGSATKRVAVS